MAGSDAGVTGRGRLKAAVALCAVGFVVSGVLTYLHLRTVADPRGYESFCNIRPDVNCDAVALSKFAVVLGVPNSVYGALFYVLVAAVAASGFSVVRNRVVRLTGHMFVLTTGALLYSFYLGGISYFRLKTLCILCTALYAVNLALFLVVGSLARGSPVRLLRNMVADLIAFARARARAITAAGVGCLLVLVLFGGLEIRARQAAAERFVGEYEDIVPVAIPRLRGVSFGPERAPVTILKFYDYGCPACREAHELLKPLLDRYPTEVRLVIKAFPQCYDCHESEELRELPVPCIAPLVARYAHTQGKWWDISNALFREYGGFETWQDVFNAAAGAGLDTAGLAAGIAEQRLLSELRLDIAGIRYLGIDEVPTFVVNGRVLPVVPSHRMLEAVVEHELGRHTARDVQRGGGRAP
jgi:uncharacterized membrane protein/predicted DsbA family dithiol-disulfide isomerase